MSKLVQNVEIYAPSHIPTKHDENIKERIVGSAQPCPICGGKGWNWAEEEHGKDVYKKRCNTCEGSGFLVPMINIEWQPLMITPSKMNEQ